MNPARLLDFPARQEDVFRTAKSILETRPVFHRCDATIRSHVFCSFLALRLMTELQERASGASPQ